LWVCGLIELYFVDETGLTMQPYVPYGWQKKGQRLGLPARITTKRINLLGLLRLDNQLTVYHSEKSLTGQFVVDCLTDFIAKDHTKPLVVVLDNGPIHRCQTVYEQQASWEDQELYLFFLPAYSPHLNPIELVWKSLKYRWLKKVDYKSWACLKKAIFAIIRNFGQDYTIDFSGLASRNIIKINSA
jgi:transposase